MLALLHLISNHGFPSYRVDYSFTGSEKTRLISHLFNDECNYSSMNFWRTLFVFTEVKLRVSPKQTCNDKLVMPQ